MKITTAGLVGFLVALSSINLPKAEATVNTDTNTKPTIESRLNRVSKLIKEKQEEALIQESPEAFDIAVRFGNLGNGVGFLNRSPSFRNHYRGFRNGGFHNGGFHNGGFRNNGGSFANRGGGGSFFNR